jgi:hypothetical protein
MLMIQKNFEALFGNGLLRRVLDHDFLETLKAEQLPQIPLQQVRAALAQVPGSMTAEFIAEREERF